MATTETQLEAAPWSTTGDAAPGADTVDRAAPAARRADPSRPLLGAWVVVVGSILVLEPAPADPQAALPAWATALAVGFSAALGATLVGLARRRPWALTASGVAAGLGLMVAGACAVTDHHPAFWWGYELVGFAALMGLTSLARRADG